MVTRPQPDPRPLPAAAARSACEGCGATVVWARTTAGPNGPGGKRIPLDPVEDLAGSYAVAHLQHGHLIARALGRDEQVDRPVDYAAMPHVATCPSPHHHLTRT